MNACWLNLAELPASAMLMAEACLTSALRFRRTTVIAALQFNPIIITYCDRVPVAAALAEAEGILPRVDILEFAEFMASNVHELGQFEDAGRRTHFGKILELYNKIVSEYETDPSLKIEIIKWS